MAAGFENFRFADKVQFSDTDYPEVAEPLPPGTYYLWQPNLATEIVYFLAREAWLRGKAAYPQNFHLYLVGEHGFVRVEEVPTKTEE